MFRFGGKHIDLFDGVLHSQRDGKRLPVLFDGISIQLTLLISANLRLGDDMAPVKNAFVVLTIKNVGSSEDESIGKKLCYMSTDKCWKRLSLGNQ